LKRDALRAHEARVSPKPALIVGVAGVRIVEVAESDRLPVAALVSAAILLGAAAAGSVVVRLAAVRLRRLG
jgi:hypothetical protein